MFCLRFLRNLLREIGPSSYDPIGNEQPEKQEDVPSPENDVDIVQAWSSDSL